jgi:quercetin dioxygenase-like cupin family protein
MLLVSMLLLGSLAARGAAGEKQATVSRSVLITERLPAVEDPSATVLRLDLEPGATVPAHRHPGSLLVYVAAGSIEIQLEADAPVTYKAGQAFFEPANHLHVLTRNPSAREKTTLIVFFVGKTGEPVTRPAG